MNDHNGEPLELRDVACRYGGRTVVERISFRLAAGKIGCLLGPSGCGKTTLLRAIAGLEPIASGEIRLGEQSLSRDGWQVAPARRRVGLVFQDFALFPHLTVADNIAFGLLDWPLHERMARVAELLQLTELTDYARAHPHQLSGGQQQRVALARTLAPRPALVLLDEPFSSLDVSLRVSLGQDVQRLIQGEQMSALLVTHDQQEAFALADEVGVMMSGKLLQWATPYQLYHEPATRAVAEFVGEGAFIDGTRIDRHCVDTELGTLCSLTPLEGAPGRPVDVLLRPDDVVHDDSAPQTAVVLGKAFRGAEFLYRLRLASGAELLALVPSHHNHQVGESIGIRLAADHVVVFAREPVPAVC